MKSTCSATLRRALGVAGFLIGFGLLSAGVANADDGESSGLLGGVSTFLTPVIDAAAPISQQVAPAVNGVAAVVEPVARPVLKAVGPVTDPVLAPIVGTAVQTLEPVLAPLRPVTAPVLTPLVRTVQDVPVVPRIADPSTTRSSAPAGAAPVVVPVVPAAPQVPVVVPEVRAVTWLDRVVVATATQQQQFGAPEVTPPIEAPSQPSPDVPFAMPGTTGSASSGGSVGPAAADLPAAAGVRRNDGSLVVIAADQVHGSWCYYYGRSHPS